MGENQRQREREASQQFQAALGRQQMYGGTRTPLLSSYKALSSMDPNAMLGGVSVGRRMEDAARQISANQLRARLSKLSGDELNDELKRLEAMMPRRI